MKPLRLLAAFSFAAIASISGAENLLVYFGSHDPHPGTGFSLAHFNTETGALTKPTFLLEAKEPAFFIFSRDGSRLYTCNSGSPGSLTAYAVAKSTGGLKLLNSARAGGADTSFISLDHTGRFVLVANYDGGSVAVFALTPDGAIGERTALDQHTGHSVNPRRQTHAYAHSIVLDATNRFALVPDLGVDKLYIYRFDEKTGALTANHLPFVQIAPGSGPRHVRFHPNGRWVYLINEIASTIVAFNWDAAQGVLTPFQTITTLPTDFTGVSACAELEILPNGKFLYATNRGHDSLAAFAIDPTSGRLSLLQHIPSGGKTPRNFAFDPTAHWIVLTNQDSSNAVVFQVDNTTGKLSRAGEPVPVPSPFCERFFTDPGSGSLITLSLHHGYGDSIDRAP